MFIMVNARFCVFCLFRFIYLGKKSGGGVELNRELSLHMRMPINVLIPLFKIGAVLFSKAKSKALP